MRRLTGHDRTNEEVDRKHEQDDRKNEQDDRPNEQDDRPNEEVDRPNEEVDRPNEEHYMTNEEVDRPNEEHYMTNEQVDRKNEQDDRAVSDVRLSDPGFRSDRGELQAMSYARVVNFRHVRQPSCHASCTHLVHILYKSCHRAVSVFPPMPRSRHLSFPSFGALCNATIPGSTRLRQ